MRVVNSMMMSNYLSNVNKNLGNMQKIQNTLLSGKLYTKSSDNPLKVSRSMGLNSNLASNNQFKTNINNASNYLDNVDTVMNQLNGVISKIRELLIAAPNAPYGEDERSAIQKEVQELINHFLQTINTNFDGRYIFGGTRVTDKPGASKDIYNIDKNGNLIGEGGEVYQKDKYEIFGTGEDGKPLYTVDEDIKGISSVDANGNKSEIKYEENDDGTYSIYKTNEAGEYLDEEGNVTNDEDKRVLEYSITADGEMLDSNGNKLTKNKDGNFVDKDGNKFSVESEKYIRVPGVYENGELKKFTDDDGDGKYNITNKDGKEITVEFDKKGNLIATEKSDDTYPRSENGWYFGGTAENPEYKYNEDNSAIIGKDGKQYTWNKDTKSYISNDGKVELKVNGSGELEVFNKNTYEPKTAANYKSEDGSYTIEMDENGVLKNPSDKDKLVVIGTNVDYAVDKNSPEFNHLGETIPIEISEGVYFDYNITIKDLFNFTYKDSDGNSDDSNIQTLLDEIISGLNSTDYDQIGELSNSLLTKLDGALNNLTNTRAKVGAMQNRMEDALAKNEDETFNMTEMLAANEDTDIPEAMINFSMLQTSYMAALQTGGMVLQKSLLDYL